MGILNIDARACRQLRYSRDPQTKLFQRLHPGVRERAAPLNRLYGLIPELASPAGDTHPCWKADEPPVLLRLLPVESKKIAMGKQSERVRPVIKSHLCVPLHGVHTVADRHEEQA